MNGADLLSAVHLPGRLPTPELSFDGQLTNKLARLLLTGTNEHNKANQLFFILQECMAPSWPCAEFDSFYLWLMMFAGAAWR